MYGKIHGGEYMGDIAAFVGNISKQRLARKSRYKVEIKGPGESSALPSINMMCESISFPGQNIRSVPDTLRYGPAREHGQGITYGPFTATFICSSDLREKDYFETWQSQIINLESWEVRYYDSYKGSLIITQLDINNNPTYAVKVEEAYPKTIMPQDMGYAQANAYQTIGIEFTYRFWRPQYIPETLEADWDPNTGTTRRKGTQGEGGVSMSGVKYPTVDPYWLRVQERRQATRDRAYATAAHRTNRKLLRSFYFG